jgi:zinc protease
MHVPLMMTAIGLLTLWAALFAQGSQRPGPSARSVMPFPATEHTLANGLKVIVVPTGFPNLVSIQIAVQAGSRNEIEPGKSGYAHFFEHLMFRGTPTNPPDRYRAIMTKAGARDNAQTGDDVTHYYATFAKEELAPVLALYADMFQNLAYSEADFKTEARAILGEYSKDSADPMEKLFEVQRDHFYQTHTYKHTTMGFLEDIENMPNGYEYSKLFFRRWYRPQFTTMIVAGDVTAAEVLPIVETSWSKWEAGSAERPSIPKEPPPSAPKYVHVPWPSDTMPIVTLGFLGPAFDEHSKDTAAVRLLATLYFGRASDLYQKLVVDEQRVDALEVVTPTGVDPSLFTVIARVKKPADALYVRDQILATIAGACAFKMPLQRLSDAQLNLRYEFARSLDSTDRIATALYRYASYHRSYDTLNNYFRTLDEVTPDDLQAAARAYFTSNGLIVTTLAKDQLPSGIEQLPPLEAVNPAPAPPAEAPRRVPPLQLPSAVSNVAVLIQKTALPQLEVKLLFTAGSAHDPTGKEGLAALTASMLSEAGSKAMTFEQIEKALYPMAGSLTNHVDKEVTAFTGRIHRDEWQAFLSIVLPQLLDPGFRDDDFRRLRDAQLAALTQDLRSNNEEELGKERLQTNVFRNTPYGHVTLGTVAGLSAVSLDDVKRFAATAYTQANLTIGISGDVPEEMVRTLRAAVAALPSGTVTRPSVVPGRRPPTNEVEIVEKDTRATAISLGFPIDVNRSHQDFPALSVAKTAFGEHRMQGGRLFQRMREVRGLNYGDYAYIEAFPGGMFTFFPSPNLVRRQQLFEIWIRPVVPVNAVMALRIAIHELGRLVDVGLTQEEFDATRDYLMKNVYVMTARQDDQLGYALDSRWYGIGEFTSYMRARLSRLTRDDVNAAIKRHLSADRLSIVIVTKDAASLRNALVSDQISPIRYDGDKPAQLLAEDKIIGQLNLHLAPEDVRVTPVAEVFSK